MGGRHLGWLHRFMSQATGTFNALADATSWHARVSFLAPSPSPSLQLVFLRCVRGFLTTISQIAAAAAAACYIAAKSGDCSTLSKQTP